MGKKKSTTTNKPIYSGQIEGAANTVTGAYNAAQPGLQAGAGQFAGIRDSILSRYNSPDNPLNAARDHYSDVLSGRYLEGNPELDAVVGRVGNDIANQVGANLGTRGLTGGSAHSGIVGREVGRAASDLRYQDWANQLARMDNAASSVGSLGQAESAMLDPAIRAYQAQLAPLMAAQDYGNTIGGLLGQYQTVKQKQSGGIGQMLGGLAGSALAGWASGGFKGV
jgi:hypothetical protein